MLADLSLAGKRARSIGRTIAGMGARRRDVDVSLPREIDDQKGIGIWACLLTALITFAVFAPSISDEFLNWDDAENFTSNPSYRGLGLPQLRWMFTTFHLGPYQPLSWMTLGLDYVVWGMRPAGYHVTSLVLHVVAAVLVYFIARRVLAAALPMVADDSTQLAVAAAVAALLFAVHPLRVESVAWVT